MYRRASAPSLKFVGKSSGLSAAPPPPAVAAEAGLSGYRVRHPSDCGHGRAQLSTALLSWAFRNKDVKPFPLLVDSPMAIKATTLYVRHYLKELAAAKRAFLAEK